MPEILLCNTPLKSDSLINHCGVNADEIRGLGLSNPAMLNTFTPYLVGKNFTALDRNVLSCLAPAPVSRELTNMSLSFGADNTVAVAEITAKLRDAGVGMMGASTSVYGNRIGGFAGAVKNYQAALMEYRQAVKSNPAAKVLAKQKAVTAFQKMQRGFSHELAAVASQSRSGRGTPLTNVTRATNIAKSSRNVVKLNVTGQVQANNLVKFSKHAKLLGNGLAIIDFGSRIGNIQNSYKAGGNWERDMFIESSSFALGASTGILAVNAGTAVLSFLLVATPIGWVGLIVGGVVVAGVAAAASIKMNNYTKENSGNLYDEIMAWINSP